MQVEDISSSEINPKAKDPAKADSKGLTVLG
jgi:hypothetical protein